MTADTLTWTEAEARFPGCAPQWDAQLIRPEESESIKMVLFVNIFGELTAAWHEKSVGEPSPQAEFLTFYAWWDMRLSSDVRSPRWSFDARSSRRASRWLGSSDFTGARR